MLLGGWLLLNGCPRARLPAEVPRTNFRRATGRVGVLLLGGDLLLGGWVLGQAEIPLKWFCYWAPHRHVWVAAQASVDA